MKDISEMHLGHDTLSISKTDLNELIRIAELGCRVTQAACNCSSDQYGSCVNPNCPVHGDF